MATRHRDTIPANLSGGLLPLARKDDLTVTEFDDEVLVFDLRAKKAHALNAAAALLWKGCDGATSVESLANTLRATVGDSFDEDVVWSALSQLQRAKLLDPELAPAAPTVTRRTILRRAAAAGVAVALLPVVSALQAPTVAEAQSCIASGQLCIPTVPCCNFTDPLCGTSGHTATCA